MFLVIYLDLLISMEISGKGLTFIPDGCFSSLTTLTEFYNPLLQFQLLFLDLFLSGTYLNDNSISSFSPQAFEGLPDLYAFPFWLFFLDNPVLFEFRLSTTILFQSSLHTSSQASLNSGISFHYLFFSLFSSFCLSFV